MEKKGFELAEMKMLVEGAKHEAINLRQQVVDNKAMLTNFQHDFYKLVQNLEVNIFFTITR